jgi:hypothetical protein
MHVGMTTGLLLLDLLDLLRLLDLLDLLMLLGLLPSSMIMVVVVRMVVRFTATGSEAKVQGNT